MFLGFPRNGRMSKGDKILDQGATSNGATGVIRIAIGPQFQVYVEGKKKALSRKAFEISKNMHSDIPMIPSEACA